MNYRRTVKYAITAAALVCAQATFPAHGTEWSPVASERLMKLPGESLEKAVENDFKRSALAQDLAALDEEIAFKQMTLRDLQAAVDRAEDADTRADMQYRFIEAKRDYLTLMRDQQTLREKRARAKVRLYETIFGRMGAEARQRTPEQSALIDRQKQARERLERTTSSVDDTLLAPVAAEGSRYATQYSKNMAAIESLMVAINNHPMNRSPSIDGMPVTREEYLRSLIAEAQGELALAQQEEAILGHMAKLVSLDALALAEGIGEAEEDAVYAEGPEPQKQVSEVIDLFIPR